MEYKKIIYVGIVFIIIFSLVFYFLLNIRKTSFEDFEINVEVLIEDLEIPWAIDFFPDGRMIFTQRGGEVFLYDDGEVVLLREIGDVFHSGEGGLHGIAVDPDFELNNFVYVYYTYSEGNRVSRFEFFEESYEIWLGNEEIILDGIPSGRNHNGGRIKFGPDKKLYITTGDALDLVLPQDMNSLAGKILRINSDGSIPEGNPFENEIYSYGHRNPQGITWNSKGELFSSEHGPTRRDRIDLIKAGKNYGWPNACDQLEEEHETAIRCYTEFTLAPSGIAFYENKLYVAGLRGTQLRKIIFDEQGDVINEEVFIEGIGRIREVVFYNGYLYIATNNRDGRGIPRAGDDKIIRILLVNN